MLKIYHGGSPTTISGRLLSHIIHALLTLSTRCLAHVINLATQVFISLCSTTAHFDPENPEEHEPDLSADVRDVVGLLRAIGVKV